MEREVEMAYPFGTLTASELKHLKSLCKKLDEIAEKEGVHLLLVEIKGTIYFYPEFRD